MPCWNCSENCSEWGICEYPGSCSCPDDYEGNGTYCVNSKVNIKTIHKLDEKTIRIGIEYRSDSYITNGFCKIDDSVEPAIIADSEKFICIVNDKLVKPVIVQLSIDGNIWSDDNIIYYPDSKISDPINDNQKNLH